MSDEALIVFDAAALTVPPSLSEVLDKWTAFCINLKCNGGIPYNAVGIDIAAEIAEGKAKATAFLALFEREAKKWREPDLDRHRTKKSATDAAVMELSKAVAELQDELLDFEARKKEVERAINAQREREAADAARIERERQAQAEAGRTAEEQAERDRIAEIKRKSTEALNEKASAECREALLSEQVNQEKAAAAREKERQTEATRLEQVQTVTPFEAAKTEGLTPKVSYDYEVTSKQLLAEYCWRSGKPWINEITFFKRDITEAINRDNAERSIPGLRVFQVLGVTTKRPAKSEKAISVSSRKVEL